MAHELVAIEWQGRQLDAFVPGPLSALPPLDAAATVHAARAEGALTGAVPLFDHLDGVAPLLLRTESTASSRVAAVSAPVDLAAVADLDRSVPDHAVEVADNLRALERALEYDGALTPYELRYWHRVLMAATDLDDELKGRWRNGPGWVGGSSPDRASHVAAPHDHIPALIDDLVDYVNEPRHDPITATALVHAQFEAIRPFADGNGRVGRLLIARMLRRHLDLAVPPPISRTVLHDLGGYLSGLAEYNSAGPDSWVQWFALALERAATTATGILTAVADQVSTWPDRLDGVRADATARLLVPHLPRVLTPNVAAVVELLEVSPPTARAALETLAGRGILRPVDLPTGGRSGRPAHWWVAGELLDLLTVDLS